MIWEMAKASIKGKWRPYTIHVHRPDPNDDDCRIIKVFDPMPLNFTYPLCASDNTASAREPAADRGKKRAAEETAAETKKKKTKKTSGRRGSSSRTTYAPPAPKPRTVGTG